MNTMNNDIDLAIVNREISKINTNIENKSKENDMLHSWLLPALALVGGVILEKLPLWIIYVVFVILVVLILQFIFKSKNKTDTNKKWSFFVTLFKITDRIDNVINSRIINIIIYTSMILICSFALCFGAYDISDVIGIWLSVIILSLFWLDSIYFNNLIFHFLNIISILIFGKICVSELYIKKRGILGSYETTGYGKKITSDSTYEGDFLKGKFHGKGKRTFANGEIWEGTFDNGVFIIGMTISADGTICSGKWVDSKLSKGRITLEDGIIFEGSFSDGKFKNGKITFFDSFFSEGVWADLTTFSGKITKKYGNGISFKYQYDNSKCIYAKATFNNELIFEKSNPEFNIIDLIDCEVYEANFTEDGKLMTKERQIFMGGYIYDGFFVDDKLIEGKMILPCGDILQGTWNNKEEFSKGRMIMLNGYIFDGTFGGNKFIKGKVTYPNGNVKLSVLCKGKKLFIKISPRQKYKGERKQTSKILAVSVK